MKVATFNLKNDHISFLPNHWSKRKDSIADFFETEAPDVVGTQELTASAIDDMERMLSGYAWIGQGRAGHNRGEFCAIFYKADKLTCMEHGTFWLAKDENTPNKRDWWAMFPRICTWALFQDRQGNRFRIYNTHLDVASPLARRNGLTLILKHVEKDFQREPYPCLLTGDFNATPNSGVLKLLRKLNPENGIFSGDSYQIFMNTNNADINRSKTYHGFRGRTEGVPVDYIFASKGISIETAEIKNKMYAGKYPSDHFPIIMKIKIEI